MLKYKIPQIVTLTLKQGGPKKNKISDLDKEHKKKLHKSMIYKALDEYSKRDYQV